MSRRSRNLYSVSLFSFQDIITATTGILILLALVLALSVIVQGSDSPIDIEYADADRLLYRDGLVVEVEQLEQQSNEVQQAASWSSATPESLERDKVNAQANVEKLSRRANELRVELQNKNQQVNSAKDKSTVDSDRSKLEDLIKEIQTKQQSLDDLTATNRIVYNFRKTSKSAWLVEISKGSILAAPVSSTGAPRTFKSVFQFNKFATTVADDERYFVLILKPSGISNFDRIKAFLEENRFELGTELIGEDQVVVDPQKGVGF